MYGQPRMAACCEMSSVSQSVISMPHSVSKRKADGRRLPPPCASREIYVKSEVSSQMEDGKDTQWSVTVTCICKSSLALTGGIGLVYT